ncbi:MAG: hypothetical protein Q8O15_00780, partial [Rectinemataceae bacterium]|nr:hypothetical protein [Rectinemataceae bacterium]
MPDASVSGYSLFCGLDLVLPPSGEDSESGLPLFPAAPQSSLPGAPFDFKGASYRAVELDEGQASSIQGATRVPVRQFIGSAPQESASFILKARAYAHWAFVARYCSFCGSPLIDGRGRDQERARVCGSCGRAWFPRLSPAIITLIHRGDEILLAHNAKFPTGRHGLIAGF